jgi:putative acyl-CoA dehydrogenase
MALAQAVNHVEGRAAFQRKLIDQPLMRSVLADLALEYEAAVAFAVRVGAAFSADDAASAALARLSVSLAKYWLTKRNPAFVYECMECHGGVGYVEETPMPRLFRESPVNGIWEGSGNVIALDVLRTLRRRPAALDAFTAELDPAAGADRAFDAAAAALQRDLSAVPEEADARRVVERMALLLQASLLLRHAPSAIADAFCATRLGADGGRLFGVLPKSADIAGILARQTPRPAPARPRATRVRRT